MLLQEGYYDFTALPSSGGLRRRSSTKLEDRPVDTGLHTLPPVKDQVHQPYLRHLRTCNDDDASSENRVGRAESDPGCLRGEEDQDAAASPAAAGMLGRFASLSASAIGSSLPLLRGLSGSFSKSDGNSASDSTSDTDSSSDTAQQQRHCTAAATLHSSSDTAQQQHDQSTHEQLARQDAASTTILLARDSDATQAAARRPTGGMRPARDPEHCISVSSSSSASSNVSCKLHDALAGQATADQGSGLLGDAAVAGHVDAALPAGSPSGARLLLSTAVGVGKGTYNFKSDKDPKKSD